MKRWILQLKKQQDGKKEKKRTKSEKSGISNTQ